MFSFPLEVAGCGSAPKKIIMKIDEKKLLDLHQYFVKEKGSTEPEDVLKRLGTEDKEVMDAYVDALREKYPQIYPPKKKVEEKYTVLLVEGNITRELEIVSISGEKIYVQEIVPTDFVTVKIGGKDVQIDLLNLQPVEGLSVETLRVIGKIAKGE